MDNFFNELTKALPILFSIGVIYLAISLIFFVAVIVFVAYIYIRTFKKMK